MSSSASPTFMQVRVGRDEHVLVVLHVDRDHGGLGVGQLVGPRGEEHHGGARVLVLGLAGQVVHVVGAKLGAVDLFPA